MMFVEAAEPGSTARSHGSTSGAHLGPIRKSQESLVADFQRGVASGAASSLRLAPVSGREVHARNFKMNILDTINFNIKSCRHFQWKR